MRKAREGIEQGQFYPEPHWIGQSKRLRFWYRFLLGRPMDGQRWTDSTFWRSATRGEDHWWLRLAGWHRALIRVSVLYALVLLLPAAALTAWLSGARSVLLLLAAHAVAALLLWTPVLIYRLIRERGLVLPWLEVSIDAEQEKRRAIVRRRVIEGRGQWVREVITPVARTAAVKLNRRFHPREVEQWVSVPRDYREGGQVEILLPPQATVLTAAQERSLARAVEQRLGMRDMSYDFQLAGNAPRLVLTAPALPPAFVSYADLLPYLERSEEYTFVIGMAGSEVLSVSLKDDSPHLALSAGSGAGKSELIKLLVAQALHWGWSILLLDWKGESQEWAEGLPGVRYFRELPALHDACVSIGEEIDFRRLNRSAEQRSTRSKTLIVSEEWGVTAPLLKEYWDQLRQTAEPEERRTMPLRSPANSALMKLNFTGRSLGMCQLLVAQRFSARVTNGNADLRESFTTIFMSRWKAQTFKMLAPDVKPVPRKLTKPGQWLAVTGDEAVICQGGFFTDEEAREWATSGEMSPSSPWSMRLPGGSGQPDVGSVSQTSTLRETVDHRSTPVSIAATPHSEPTLRKLVDLSPSLEYLGVTARQLRRAATEDPAFPAAEGGDQFKGYLYDRAKVNEYWRRRRAEEAARAKGGKA